MSTIAKLFVLDDKGDRVGTFVLDLEALFQLYRQQKAREMQADKVEPFALPATAAVQWEIQPDGTMVLRTGLQRPTQRDEDLASQE